MSDLRLLLVFAFALSIQGYIHAGWIAIFLFVRFLYDEAVGKAVAGA